MFRRITTALRMYPHLQVVVKPQLTKRRVSSAIKLPKGPRHLFGESHDDSATGKILKRLAPSIRYFKDELPSRIGMEEHMKLLEQSSPILEEIKPIFDANKLDIANPEHHIMFEAIWFKLFGITEETVLVHKIIKTNLEDKESNEVYKDVLKTFKQNNTRYETCDLDILLRENPAQFDENIRKRDVNFVENYLATEESFHSRNGIGHFTGFQREILKRVPFDVARVSFNFFHIFSKPVPKEFDLNYLQKQGLLPLGCKQVDLAKLGEEDALRSVQDQIKRKEEEFQDFRHKASHRL